ncbi:MAG: tyrosine-protein phosphatase, partial [Clostridia bacterium]|nr:tyrosine-protein phosphatase [Clostridia bacterium]
EIDLRESVAAGDGNENGGLTASVLGDGVAYYNCSMLWNDSLGEKSLSRIKDIFAILADENNYPLYFHCRIGTDRTGLVAWLVNALCGVSENDLWRDYLFSNFGYIESARTKSKIENRYVKDIKEMPGDTFADKTYNYLKTTLQVPEADLDAVIRIMKEPAK